MAPPHRRSCLACVKAKRRCDLTLPTCQRCLTKALTCDYSGLGNGAPLSAPSANQEQTNVSPAGWLPNESLESHDAIAAPTFEERQDGTDFADPAWLSTTSSSHQVNRPSDLSGIPSPYQLDWLPDLDDAAIDGYVSTRPPTFQPGDDYITTGTIYHERVRFASRRFKTYPEMFYKRGQNPFIHRHLYTGHVPLVIQDALSACALYCGKNSENELLVFSDISRKASGLTELKCPSLSPVDLLASTQALLLYQIIRLFDGDIRQRADAESHETIVVSWTEQLLGRVQQLPLTMDLDASSPDSPTTSSWQDWIFEESCRRTILTSFMLQGVYSFLKFGYDNVSGRVNRLSFTGQAAIWDAPSEYHWREAFKAKNAFQVTISQWDIVMEGVKPEDLEELGMMVLASHKGMDITCEWLGRENLPRWGLEWGTIGTRDS
ncbi:hypothetical protein B7494_g5558 [Chlorociboria aeruginascens]|nr:hypothetical protein B7494_g5558 [Chlorociboria aeruginascens]